MKIFFFCGSETTRLNTKFVYWGEFSCEHFKIATFQTIGHVQITNNKQKKINKQVKLMKSHCKTNTAIVNSVNDNTHTQKKKNCKGVLPLLKMHYYYSLPYSMRRIILRKELHNSCNL